MKLEESLKKKRFVVTSEIQPPIETDVQDLIRSVDRIRGKVDALTVPDLKIEGLVADTMGTCRILKEQKFEPILQTACREKSRVDIQEHLLKVSESGIENILTFTEDYRITGDSLQEIMYFHVDSGKLYSVIDGLREGRDISGKQIPFKPKFCIGSGVDSSWGKKVPDMELREMETLANLGTQYFLTTPVFDLDSFHQFMNRVGPIRVPVIAEVILVRSAGMGIFLNKYVRPGLVPNHIIEKLAKAPDKEKTSIEIIRDLVKGLREVCQGVHFVPVGSVDRVSKYLDAVAISV
ncbi:MAG TPA: methylenetetrahydrofolate reductase [Thermodesulfobacteriota bacterium]|nr:methylenetetrahydrofolate reductase [Thermodesulfobacteriota bacterium]